jgi:hypothetical protein
MQNENLITYLTEKNLWSFINYFCDINSCYSCESFDYNWIKTDNCDWPNFINYINLKGIDSEELFSHLARQSNPSFCLIGPNSSPTDILDGLIEHSFKLVDVWSGMEYDKSSKKQLMSIDHFAIQKVVNLQMLESWIETCKMIFFPKKKINEQKFTALLNDKRFMLYIGLYNNFPVATSLSFHSDGVYGLYNIGTLKEYRNKGIGFIMTHLPVEEILQKNNNEPIILQATSIGEPVYKKVGFNKVCDFVILSRG